jgi:hypothetical protein
MKNFKLKYLKCKKNIENSIKYGKKLHKMKKIRITPTFFSTIHHQCEENTKDAPKFQLFRSVLRFLRPF